MGPMKRKNEEEESTMENTSVEDSDIDEGSARLALFAAVEGDGTEQVLSCRPLVKLLFREAKQSTVLASIQSHKFHKGHARRFFAGITPILNKVLQEESYVPASAYESDDEKEETDTNRKPETIDPSDVVPDPKSTEALEFLKASALCVSAYLEGLVGRRSDTDTDHRMYQVVDEAYGVAELLHSVLFSLHSCGAKGVQVQTSIASLCELWWHQRFVDREALVVQLLPLLVVRSLDANAQKTDVKRLFHIREALTVLDFENESIAYLRSLFLRSVSSPLYLRVNEGKRFIAGLFHLHNSLVRDLHQAIRVQIPDAKKTILQAYGEIYFRAWKESEDQVRSAIEERALQDLMYAVLHIANPTMAKSIQTILEPFHDAKKNSEVESLLHCMYGPILWRAIKAANPRVRMNAAAVLAVTFPLKAYSLGHKETERAVQKGTKALKDLLIDSDPRVRVAGSEATATILATFWDVLPVTDIRMLLNHIVAEHASDASSSAVRAGAVNAVTLLLDAEESHAVLRALLPSVGNLIHDKVERVRLATVRMLLRVKRVSGIKYYHVVPVEHLIARLAEEGFPPSNPQGPVPSALTELMLNSYCPQGPNVSGVDQVKRTIAFLTTDPIAAHVFYSNVAAHLSVTSVAKLAAMLLRCLCAAVDTDKAKMAEIRAANGKKRRRYGKQQEDEEDGAGDDDTVLTAANTPLMASLARTICCLWESIEIELKEPVNEPCNEFLFEAFSGAVLTDVHAHFEQKASENEELGQRGSKIRDDCYRTNAAILRCAGRLPPKAVEGLASHISSKLADLNATIDDDTVHENITPHIALLCLWGMTEDVASSLSASIQSAFGDDDELISSDVGDGKRSSNKRRSGRNRKEDLAVPPLPARVALEVLGELLRGPDPSSVAAREAILSSSAACNAFEMALEVGTVRAERLLQSNPMFAIDMSEKEIELILKSCEAYGRFALHKEASKIGRPGFSLQAKTLLDWTTDRVIPVLSRQGNVVPTPFADLNISRISAVTESPMQPSSPTPMPPPRQRTNRNKTPERGDSTFGSIGDKEDIDIAPGHESTALLAHGVAVSLLQSSCVIFAEWLAVGGSGSDEIAASASNWCKIFTITEDKTALQAELQPAFTRLAVQLCKTSSNFSVLQQLIASCDETKVEENADESIDMKKTVSTLLMGRDEQGNTLVDGAVGAVLGAARSILEKAVVNNNEALDMPLALSELWDVDKGSVFSSLSAVLNSKQAAVVLAAKLVAHFDGDAGAADQTQVALFEAKLLWLLCDGTSGGGSVALKKAMGKLDADSFAGDGPVKDVLRNVAESLAV